MEQVPATIFVVSILIVLGFIVAVAIKKYSTVDEALRVIAALVGLFGATVGAAGSYFFTRNETQLLANQRDSATTRAKEESQKAEQITDQSAAALQALSTLAKATPEVRRQLKAKYPEVGRILQIDPQAFEQPQDVLTNHTKDFAKVADLKVPTTAPDSATRK